MAKQKNTPPNPSEQPPADDQPGAGEPGTNAVTPRAGDIVMMVLPEHDSKGEIRPAIVVRVFKGTNGGGGMPLINAQQFTDGKNDITDHPVAPTTIWRTSLAYDPTGKQPGTWHWQGNED